MTKTTVICDRCKKEFNKDDRLYGREVKIGKRLANEIPTQYELCMFCSRKLLKFMEGKNEDNA